MLPSYSPEGLFGFLKLDVVQSDYFTQADPPVSL